MLVPLVGNLCFTCGTTLDTETEQTCALVAPGLLPTTDVDINPYHRSVAHTHHRLLLRSAEQGVKLKKGSKLLPCVGCSMAKGINAPVNKVTEYRSDKKLWRFLSISVVRRPLNRRGPVCHDRSG